MVLVVLTYRVVFLPPRPKANAVNDKKPVVSKSEEKAEDASPLPNINVEKPEISHIVDGQVAWTVGADSIESDAEAGVTRLVNSRGMFVMDGDRGLEFTSPLTVYNVKTKDVRVEGDINGKIVPEDHTLTAGGISWDEKTGMIVAGDVEVVMNGAALSGGRMELRPDNKKAVFYGGVRIKIPVERKGLKVGSGM